MSYWSIFTLLWSIILTISCSAFRPVSWGKRIFSFQIYLFDFIWSISSSSSSFRKLTTVNAFLSGLALVLDHNFQLGNILLFHVLRLLRYLPLPSIDENISIRVSQLQAENSMPHYTIGLLNTQARSAWISSFLVVLYKVLYSSLYTSPLLILRNFLLKIHFILVSIRCVKWESACAYAGQATSTNCDQHSKFPVSQVWDCFVRSTSTQPEFVFETRFVFKGSLNSKAFYGYSLN